MERLERQQTQPKLNVLWGAKPVKAIQMMMMMMMVINVGISHRWLCIDCSAAAAADRTGAGDCCII